MCRNISLKTNDTYETSAKVAAKILKLHSENERLAQAYSLSVELQICLSSIHACAPVFGSRHTNTQSPSMAHFRLFDFGAVFHHCVEPGCTTGTVACTDQSGNEPYCMKAQAWEELSRCAQHTGLLLTYVVE